MRKIDSPSDQNLDVPCGSEAGLFEIEFEQCMRDLQATLAALVEASGGDANRPQDMSREFGLDKSLTWKASRLLQVSDPTGALRFVPGAGGLRILSQGLGRTADGAPRVEFMRAVHRFEKMVSRHAGDRATLEMLAQGLDHTRGDGEISDIQSLLRTRREAFRGNAAMWGVQASVQFCMTSIAPSPSAPGMLDARECQGVVDFRRIRADMAWHPFSMVTPAAGLGPTDQLDAQSSAGGPLSPDAAPLLLNFCSDPAPNVKVVHSGPWTRFELAPGPVGNTNLESLTLGVEFRAFASAQDQDPKGAVEIGIHCATPVEFAQLDVLVHRELKFGAPSQAQMLGTMLGRVHDDQSSREGRSLPLEAPVESLGRGLAQFHSEQLPRHPELAEFMLAGTDTRPEDYDAFRVSMRHPPVPTALLLPIPMQAR